MRARLGPAAAGAAVSVMLLAACGDDAPGISEEASNNLQYQVEAVRASAQSFDPAGVEHRLGELRASVAQLEAEGELDDERAAEILAAAADVEARIDLVPTTTTAPPPPPPPPEDDEDDDDKGNKGKGDDD
jgi:hypothetical protein